MLSSNNRSLSSAASAPKLQNLLFVPSGGLRHCGHAEDVQSLSLLQAEKHPPPNTR